jgi:hypothetical protein
MNSLKNNYVAFKIKIMNINILSEEKINKIVDLAEQTYYNGIINMDIEQSLMVMLSITHYFKFEMDYKIQWYTKNKDRMDKEVEQFKAEQGIKDLWDEKEWIHKNGAMQYNIGIQDLFLQTLYTLNGTHYHTRNRDYEWEEEFDKIFVGMPYGRELDIAMIRFLLLPLYNCTHRTNYVMQGDEFKHNDELTNG